MKSLRTLKMAVNTLIISSIVMASGHALADNFYKWVDSQGTTHYTKTPPPKTAKKRSTVETYGFTPPSDGTTATEPTTPSAADPAAAPVTPPPAAEAPPVTAEPVETIAPAVISTGDK